MHMFLALILSFLSEQTTHCDEKVVEHEVKLPLSSAFAHGFFPIHSTNLKGNSDYLALCEKYI